MARVCEITGRRPVKGRSYAIRGIAKKKKGIGLKITGKTKRRFCPNLFDKKFWHPTEKRFIKMRVSAAAIRNIEKLGLESVLAQKSLSV